jgi:UDP:flavonoid glycosyltransferase YjiC (YdhE family)
VRDQRVKRYLFIPLSSPGCLYPAIRLGHILERGGHEVLFATTSEYSIMLETQGLSCIGVRQADVPFLGTNGWYLASHAETEVPLLSKMVEHFRPDVIVTNPLVLASFVLAERHRVPLYNIAYAESLYPGARAGDGCKEWRLGVVTGFYNDYRRALGLSAVAADPVTTPLYGDRCFLRSSPELYDGDDVQSRVEFIGDLYWEPAYENVRLRRFCQQQRAAGMPLIYVQLGRLFEERDLWAQLLSCFARMDAAFVFDLGRADYLDKPFIRPPNCFFSAFVPLGAIRDDVELVICSAQSTTCISAIVHNKQILCLPHSADGDELTTRLERRGVAIGLHGPDRSDFDMLQGAVLALLDEPLVENVERYQRTLLDYDDARVYSIIDAGFQACSASAIADAGV